MRTFFIGLCALIFLASPAATRLYAQAHPATSSVEHGPSKTAQAYYAEGVTAFNTGKWDQAITSFTAAIKKRKDPYADAYYARGLCYNRREEYSKAVADFDESLKIKTELAPAYFERGNAYAGLGRFLEAVADYAMAQKTGVSQRELGSPRVRAAQAFVARDYTQALAEWRTSLTQNPRTPAVMHFNMGLAYIALADQEKGDFATAAEELTVAINLKPDYVPALLARASAYLRMEPKKYAEAKADAEAVLKKEPSNAEAQRLLEQAKANPEKSQIP